MKTINKKIHGLRLMISNHKYICIFSIVIIALSISGYWWARSTEETASYFTWLIDLNFEKIELPAIVVSVFVALLTMEQNARITEGKLIKELNSEFINNEALSRIEAKLEKSFAYYMNSENPTAAPGLDIDPTIGGKDRQALVNYLVHLEAVAALVNNNILRLGAINDLVAYRFFIALNNPSAQEREIKPYSDYYSGCIKLYKKWKDILRYKHIHIPMEENGGVIEGLAWKLKEKGI